MEALREAVINAIVHRDYRIPANILVEIYDDRIEIWSLGKLPPGIRVEDLYKKRASICNKESAKSLRCFMILVSLEIRKWNNKNNRAL